MYSSTSSSMTVWIKTPQNKLGTPMYIVVCLKTDTLIPDIGHTPELPSLPVIASVRFRWV